MPTWKKIALADEVGSLGTIDQTIPLSTNRTININEGSLNVVDIGHGGENYLKIAQPSITLGSTNSTNGNDNAKLQCANSVSSGLSWNNGLGGAFETLGVNRFRLVNNPLTLQNHPNGASNGDVFLKGPSFVMTCNGLNFGQQIPQTIGVTVNGPIGTGAPAVYGGIQWDVTTVGNNFSDSSDPDYFTKFETKCTIATQKGTGSGANDVITSANSVTALELTGGPDAADNGHTANEQTLSEVSFYSTELEALTRRNLLTFQCGFTEGQVMTANNGGVALLAMKIGDVQCAAGTTLTTAHGIVLPFGGFIAGGSFSAERPDADTSTAVSGNISLFVRKVFGSTGTSHQDIRLASATGNVPNKIRSDEYPINNTNHRTTGDTGVQFDAGDVIVPFFRIDPDNTDTIRVQDLIAQIFIYTESIVA